MIETIELGDIVVNVTKKDIKNVHLSVYPPTGKVRISAPERMSLDTIRVFAISKLSWIKENQHKLQSQARETPREYVDRESQYVWGRRYLLKVIEADAAPRVEIKHRRLVLGIRPGTPVERREAVVAEWYREQLKAAAPAIIAKWEPIMGVAVERVHVQRMKTRWGGCNPHAGAIRLNAELAKKPRQCLEYIIVHEMTHLLEPTHNSRFHSLLSAFMPDWQVRQSVLNDLPVRHERWSY